VNEDANDGSTATAATKKSKQQDVNDVMRHTSLRKRMSQSEFDTAVLHMLLEDMMPISTVERSGFQKFCASTVPHLELPSRRTFVRRVNADYSAYETAMIAESNKVEVLSCTADLWTSHNRGYLGMTLHYIDPQTLKRVSHALCCRRFQHSHTGQRFAEVIAGVLKKMKIVERVVTFVSDNASNMAKAFNLLRDVLSVDAETSECEPDDVDNVDVIPFENVISTWYEPDAADGEYESELETEIVHAKLLQHKRCANHALNLVAEVDGFKARENAKYRRTYDSAMAKVQALSNAVHRSTKNADIVEDVVGVTFRNPTCTRCSSSYTAVKRIVDVGITKVTECQEKIGLQKMTDEDMRFLQNYVEVMQPIAIAMNKLQGEEGAYIGILIPEILEILFKLKKVTDKVKSMMPLIKALQAGIQQRFGDVLQADDYNIAVMLTRTLMPRPRTRPSKPRPRTNKLSLLIPFLSYNILTHKMIQYNTRFPARKANLCNILLRKHAMQLQQS
jgi:hypothetical protein